jgi:hypothetical protein
VNKYALGLSLFSLATAIFVGGWQIANSVEDYKEHTSRQHVFSLSEEQWVETEENFETLTLESREQFVVLIGDEQATPGQNGDWYVYTASDSSGRYTTVVKTTT